MSTFSKTTDIQISAPCPCQFYSTVSNFNASSYKPDFLLAFLKPSLLQKSAPKTNQQVGIQLLLTTLLSIEILEIKNYSVNLFTISINQWLLSIMPKLPKFSVGNQMEKYSMTGNFQKKGTSFERCSLKLTKPVSQKCEFQTCSLRYFASIDFHLHGRLGKAIENGQGCSSQLA